MLNESLTNDNSWLDLELAFQEQRQLVDEAMNEIKSGYPGAALQALEQIPNQEGSLPVETIDGVCRYCGLQQVLSQCNGEDIYVDACLVEALQTLWDKDYDTWTSCCGHGGRPGYIGISRNGIGDE